MSRVLVSGRHHALDALRAVMMLLGIVIHAGLSYVGREPLRISATSDWPVWGFMDRTSSAFCSNLIVASGKFRMAIFFMMAGFFAALIERKRGPLGLLRNRCWRIGVPLLVGWVVTFPLLRCGFVFGAAIDEPHPWRAVAEAVRSGRIWTDPYPIHLWFLEYLLIYYVAAVALLRVVRGVGDDFDGRWKARFRYCLGAWWRSLPLAMLSAIPLCFSETRRVETPLSFLTDPVSLSSFAVFFSFGWVLFLDSDFLPLLGRYARGELVTGIGFSISGRVAMMVNAGRFELSTYSLGGFVPSFVNALTTWLLVLGISGLFVGYCKRTGPITRYLTEASYWLYLAHFPLVVWVPILLAPLELPALAKVAIELAILFPVLIGAYELVVRRTPLGSVLGGRIPLRSPTRSREGSNEVRGRRGTTWSRFTLNRVD